jgi:hypothetical protein
MNTEYRIRAQELADKLPKSGYCTTFEVVNQHGKLLFFSIEGFEDDEEEYETPGIMLYKDDYADDGLSDMDYTPFLVDKEFITTFKAECGIGAGFKNFTLNADERNHHYDTSSPSIAVKKIRRILKNGSI